MTTFCYSLDNENFTGNYDTIEDAKLACILQNDLALDTIYYIGEVVKYNPRDFISILDFVAAIHTLAVHKTENAKVVDKWPDVSPSKYHELREMVGDFFERNYPTDFFTAKNVVSFTTGE